MKKPICIDIEKAIGKEVRTPKDFEELRGRIYERLHLMISSTTLKRIWGYLNDNVQTRPGTLDILAQYIGYSNFQDYTNSKVQYQEEIQSSPVMSRKLNVQDELSVNDKLLLTWHPNRQCEIIYMGNLSFRVLSSCNTRILRGDTFTCSLFIEGEPLYIDNLQQGSKPPVAYVCGKMSGIRFEFIK
jgi:hypothetical protein